MNLRVFYLLLCGLFLAGIVHITIILLIPHLGSKDVANRIASLESINSFELIGDGRKIGIANSDPYFQLAVCKFDLTTNAIQIVGAPTTVFWSASIFDDRGRVVYSLSNRTAIERALQLIVLTPVQIAILRQSQPEEIDTSIIVETNSPTGFVLLRILQNDPTRASETKKLLETAQCLPFET